MSATHVVAICLFESIATIDNTQIPRTRPVFLRFARSGGFATLPSLTTRAPGMVRRIEQITAIALPFLLLLCAARFIVDASLSLPVASRRVGGSTTARGRLRLRRFTLSASFHLRLYFLCPLFVRRSHLVNIYFVNPIIMAAVPTDIVDEVGPRPFVASLLLHGAK